MRRAIGYVRDENGDFEEKEKAITKFAEENNLIVERIYFEQSGCEIEEISKLNEISEKYENIILLVNDISDIFESNEHIIIAMRLWEKDILVIDTSYPAFRYENIIKEVCNNPDDFLRTKAYIIVKTYLRKISDKEYCGNFDLMDRVVNWEKEQEGTNND